MSHKIAFSLVAERLGQGASHPALLYIATLSPSSRRFMRSSLDILAAEVSGGAATHMTCPWATLRFEHTRWLRSQLVKRYKPASVNRHLAALRGVLKYCFRLGLMSAEDYQHAVQIRDVRVSPRMRGLSPDELLRILKSCDDDDGPLATRDSAILALLYGTGLRCSETASLRLGDYDGESLTVGADAAAQRVLPLNASVKRRLDKWLAIRGRHKGPIFLQVNKSPKVLPKGLSSKAIIRTCYRRADAVGMDRFSPTDLRRSFMLDLLEAGADVVSVSRLAGHATLRAASGYNTARKKPADS